jgi:hypothetical protein
LGRTTLHQVEKQRPCHELLVGVNRIRAGLSLAFVIFAMAHREFTDSAGRSWNVWSVVPERAERRRHSGDVDHAAERRHTENKEFRVPLGEQWTRGWLAFETKGEKRRLAPIPEHWETASEEQLDRMLERAEQIRRPPRRLAE